MTASRRTRRRTPRLTLTHLEDRTVPAGIQTRLSEFAPDRLLVSYADSADHRAELMRVPTSASVTSLGLGTYAITVTTGVSPTAAVSLYSGQPGVVAATPDYVITADLIPNDPSFGSEWGLHNTGQSGGVADADIDAPEAWNVQTGTRGTIVAVIDTGVDYTHPDLAANMWQNPGEVGGDGVDNDGDGYVDNVYGYDFANNDGNPMDDNGHGTHVAGVIGAVGNNGIGIAGVNWNTRIMALKFLDANGSGYTSAAVSALNFAVTNGALVSNNSWGGGGATATLATAIANARTAGHIFVAAAGNSGANNDSSNFFPANYSTQYDNVVSVAAVDRTGALASFSNYGATKVTLAAPGVSIYSTLPGNSYGNLSGTSMATPFVSGAIALLRDQNPTWSYSQVVAKLKSSVDVLANLAGKVSTGGRLNVAKMLDASSVPPTPPPPPTFVSGPKVTGATFTGPNATTFTGVRFTFDKPVLASSFTTADVVSLTGPAGSFSASGVTAVAGTNNTRFDVTFAAKTAGGAYTITIGPNVTDAAGNAMNQDGDTTNGETPADRYTTSASLADGRFAFSAGNLPLTIPDFSTVNIPIVVNQSIAISDLNVVLNVTHTYDSDLRMTLKGPDGTTVTLVNRRGGSGDNFATTTFDTEATGSITSGKAPFNGSFRPESSLAVFNGKNAQGTWTLTISDLARLDSGRVNAATLSIAGNPGGLKALTLAMSDDEVVAPEPTVTAGEAEEVKYRTPVLFGVWVTPDDSTGVKKPDPLAGDRAAESARQMARFAARRSAEWDLAGVFVG